MSGRWRIVWQIVWIASRVASTLIGVGLALYGYFTESLIDVVFGGLLMILADLDRLADQR